MSKYMLAAAVAVAFAAAPLGAFAQNADKSTEVKGPPNANGAQHDDMKKGDMGRSSSDSSGSNGAASAKATGADKH